MEMHAIILLVKDMFGNEKQYFINKKD